VGYTKGLNVAILDTSILLLVAKRELNLDRILEQLAGLRAVATKPVVEELAKLSREHSERGRLASWLLETIVNNVVDVIEEDCHGDSFDDRILCTAEKLGAVVVTADLEMAKKARRRGIKVAIFRRSKRGVEGPYNTFS